MNPTQKPPFVGRNSSSSLNEGEVTVARTISRSNSSSRLNEGEMKIARTLSNSSNTLPSRKSEEGDLTLRVNSLPINSLLPTQSPDYKFISCENKAEGKGSLIKYKFEWKEKIYTITWLNPQEIISDADKNTYIDNQIDKIILLVERHLYVDNKSLKCSLDLQKVTRTKKRKNGSEVEKNMPSPFDFRAQIDKKIAQLQSTPLDKEKKIALHDAKSHAEAAEKLRKKAGIPSLNLNSKPGLDKYGHLKIEKKDEDSKEGAYGPFGYAVKLIVDGFTYLFKALNLKSLYNKIFKKSVDRENTGTKTENN